MTEIEVARFFRRKAARKICAEKLKLPRFENKFIAPGKEKFAQKIKATNLQVLRFRNKIEAHHIAQLYDRLKQFCCLSVQTLDSMSVVDAGFLLLLPPALSPAAALLLAQRGSPSQVKSEVQTLAHTFYPPKKVAPPLIRVANVFSLNSPQRVSIEGEFCADFKNVQKD